MANDTERVLIVDDDDQNLQLIQTILTPSGYEVRTADSGREAMKALESEPFDLVLLDVVMPDMDGITVLRRIHTDAKLRQIPVVMISGVNDLESVAKCVELGADDYLFKPIKPTLLRARVKASLEKKRLKDQEQFFLRRVQEEKLRGDKLLHSVLPHMVVEELLATGSVIPRRYNNVAVLFADIVGFTAYCETHDPGEILQHLESLFGLLEDMASKHQLDKVKTIGDAFMAAGGMLTPLDNPVLACVNYGLEIVAASPQLDPHWKIRVGIHKGPVVAGIVGKSRISYNIWGDTVNTASRIESYGVADAVNVSQEAWQEVAHLFRGKSQGVVELKNKGKMEIISIGGPA